MIREWQNSLRQQKSTSVPKGRSANVILSYKVGIKAHIKAVMTECEADLECKVFFKAVNHIRLEAWVMVAVIVFVFIYEQLKLATLVHIHATLFCILQLGVQIPCVLATHTVARCVLRYVIDKRSIGRMTALELTIYPSGKVALLAWQY